MTAPAPVWMPQPRVPAISSGTPSGTFTTLRSVVTACVANEDWPKKLPEISPLPSRIDLEPSLRWPTKFSAAIAWQ